MLSFSGASWCLGDGDLDNCLRSLVVSLGDSAGGCCSTGTLDLYGDRLRLVKWLLGDSGRRGDGLNYDSVDLW